MIFCLAIVQKYESTMVTSYFSMVQQFLWWQKQTKFLCICWTSKLNVLSHIRSFQSECHWLVESCSTNRLWDRSSEPALLLYVTCSIKARLRQCSAVYTQLENCISYWVISNIPCGKPSLDRRRTKLSLQYATKLYSNTDNSWFEMW